MNNNRSPLSHSPFGFPSGFWFRHSGFPALLLLLTLPVVAAAADNQPAKEQNNLPLAFNETFADPEAALKRFTFTDPAAWTITEDTVDGQKRSVLSLTRQSNYKPPVRSPVNIAWINGLQATHFVMDVKVRSTQKDIPNRDMCFFFGRVDATHFGYAHLAKAKSPNHNDLFVVDGKDRAPVSTFRSEGSPWTAGYHTVRITRDESGVTVLFDGKQMLAGSVKELATGQLGVGTFDDIGNIAEITVWAKKVE